MALAKITGQGLSAIAFLVALLWACVLGENALVSHANEQVARAMRDNRMMRRQAQPVRAPSAKPVPPRPAMG